MTEELIKHGELLEEYFLLGVKLGFFPSSKRVEFRCAFEVKDDLSECDVILPRIEVSDD
jgi:hypothetical protein